MAVGGGMGISTSNITSSGAGLDVTTKGDIQTFSTEGARLPVGTNDQILVADNTTETGLKWQDASGGSQEWVLVAEETVTGSDQQSIDFTGLDSDTDGNYLILINKVNGNASSSSNVSTFINNDTTATNYYSQYNASNNTTISAARQNAAYSFGVPAGSSGSIWMWVMHDGADYARVISNGSIKSPSSVEIEFRCNSTAGTVTNITRITLQSDRADGWGVGSNVQIFKVKG
jgi:hypothetical protein